MNRKVGAPHPLAASGIVWGRSAAAPAPRAPSIQSLPHARDQRRHGENTSSSALIGTVFQAQAASVEFDNEFCGRQLPGGEAVDADDGSGEASDDVLGA